MTTLHPLAPLAASLGCDVPAVAAVLAVESLGLGHGLVGGRPLIRLEVHHLWRHVPDSMRTAVDVRFHVDGPEPWEGHRFHDGRAGWVRLHQPGEAGQAVEWRAYGVAAAIDQSAAIRATSWGVAQILGDHWRRCGFACPAAFVAAQQSEAGQLDTFARFVRGDPALLAALVAHDWRAFAARYNGAGKVEHYAGRLADECRRAGGR
jgi:hypothetical protein